MLDFQSQKPRFESYAAFVELEQFRTPSCLIPLSSSPINEYFAEVDVTNFCVQMNSNGELLATYMSETLPCCNVEICLGVKCEALCMVQSHYILIL